jgi:hypothetical protein
VATKTDLLHRPRFVDAIERIARRRTGTLAEPSLGANGVSLATIHRDRANFAARLVRDLADGACPEVPGRIYFVETEGKRRRLFDLPLVELIIHDALASWLAERFSPTLSPCLYSYQRGLSYHVALRAFARYVRGSIARQAKRPDRGVYVLRRDVYAYFDSIPVADDAALWPVLRERIGRPEAGDPSWTITVRALRPLLVDRDGLEYRLTVGIPTGSPVANVIANAYLGDMDAALTAVPGAFYARYGDDIVAAHPDAAVAATLATLLDAHLADRSLAFNVGKRRDAYLTRRGGAPGASRPDDTEEIEVLGHRVSAGGTIRLSSGKTRVLLDDLRRRARNGAAGRTTVDSRIGGAVRAVNRLLDPESAAAHPYSKLLYTTVTDRPYLKWLDHEASTIVLEVATGRRSPRNFRRCSMSELRQRFGLTSLVATRNRGSAG